MTGMIMIMIEIITTITREMIRTITIGTKCTTGTNKFLLLKSDKLFLPIGDEKPEGTVFMNLKRPIGWRQKEASLKINL